MSRSWVSLVCILAGFLALGGRAHAGATGSPFGGGVCPDIFATDNMGDPTLTGFNNAATAKTCVKLCSQAASLCRSFSKRSFSCVAAWENTRLSFNKANCVIITSNPTDRKACDANAKDNHDADISGFKTNLANALTDCDSWKTTCEGTCGL